MKLLCTIFAFFVVAFASATEYISLTQCDDETYVSPGTMLQAEVGWHADGPIDGLRTWVCWDDQLDFIGIEWSDSWAEQWIEVEPDRLFIECLGDGTPSNGTVGTLTMRIRSDAESGFAAFGFCEPLPWPAHVLVDDYWWSVSISYVPGVIVTPLGDCNCDGSVNAMDIDPFVAALSGAADYDLMQPVCNRMLADCNSDGSVNALDVEAFVERIAE